MPQNVQRPAVALASRVEADVDIDSGGVKPDDYVPVAGDSDYWHWQRSHIAFTGWSDYEVIATIWHTDHPQQIAKAREICPWMVVTQSGEPHLSSRFDKLEELVLEEEGRRTRRVRSARPCEEAISGHGPCC